MLEPTAKPQPTPKPASAPDLGKELSALVELGATVTFSLSESVFGIPQIVLVIETSTEDSESTPNAFTNPRFLETFTPWEIKNGLAAYLQQIRLTWFREPGKRDAV